MRTVLVTYSRGRSHKWLLTFARLCHSEGHDCTYASLNTPEPHRGEVQFASLCGGADTGLDRTVNDLANHQSIGDFPEYFLDALSQSSHQLCDPLSDILQRAGAEAVVTEGVVALSLVGRLNETCRLPGLALPWLHVVAHNYKYALQVSSRQRSVALKLLQTYIKQPDVVLATAPRIARRVEKDYGLRRAPLVVSLDELSAQAASAGKTKFFLRRLFDRSRNKRQLNSPASATATAKIFSHLRSETAAKRQGQELRVWHGPADLTAHCRLLSDALGRGGVFSRCTILGPNNANVPVDKHFRRRDVRSGTRALVEIARRFDVAHFFARSLYQKTDLRLPTALDMLALRAAGVTVIMTLDSQDLALLERTVLSYIYALASGITVPDPTGRVIPAAEILPHAIGNFRHDLPTHREIETPRVLYLFGNDDAEQRGAVVDAIEALRARGLRFHFERPADLSSSSMASSVQHADIVIDQCCTGWYSDRAAECMAHGKTVIVQLKPDLVETFGKEGPPFPVADGQTLQNRLQELLQSASVRRAWAERGRRYALATHDADNVAAAHVAYYARIRQNPIPVDVTKVIELVEYQASIQQQFEAGLRKSIEKIARDLARL